jgi:hypothetical protein
VERLPEETPANEPKTTLSLKRVTFFLALMNKVQRSFSGLEDLNHSVRILLPPPSGSPVAFDVNADIAIEKKGDCVIGHLHIARATCLPTTAKILIIGLAVVASG